MGFKLLIGISKCCVTQRGGDTHTLTHTLTAPGLKAKQRFLLFRNWKPHRSKDFKNFLPLFFSPLVHEGENHAAYGQPTQKAL